MTNDDLGKFILRRPFVPFKFWLRGGFRVRVASTEFLTEERQLLAFAVHDVDETFVFFYADEILALRSLGPVEEE